VVYTAMLSRIRTFLWPASSARYLNFVPLCRLPPDAAETWHHCPPMILSDIAYNRLHEFLQANLEGRWSLMPQDHDCLDKYDVLLDLEAEAGLIDLFKITIGMRDETNYPPSGSSIQ
jgi:hypothetical protein